MVTLVKLIGVFFIAVGAVYLVSPGILKKALALFGEGKKPYLLAGIRIVIGFILVMAAPQCRVVWFVTAFGLLAVFAGLTIFIIGLEKCRSMIKNWEGKPDKTLRLLCLIPMIVGWLLLNAA